MKAHYRFIEPLDSLILRGNKLFGGAGSFGEAQLPPWPSVAAGALRSRMLVDAGIRPADFASGRASAPQELGTPEAPGGFTLAHFGLARRLDDGHVEWLMPPPADLVVAEGQHGRPQIRALRPATVSLASSYPLTRLPVMAQPERRKPLSGYWLTQRGWQSYLNGRLPESEHLLSSDSLWQLETRTGIGMNRATRSVEEGRLFTTQAVAFRPDVGFLAGVLQADPPRQGLLRFGGDGHAARIQAIETPPPAPDYDALCRAGRCRLILTSPGIFPGGWQLPGLDDSHRLHWPGLSARLVSAAVHRADTVSGWDLAKRRPKPAQQVAATGSVYWLDELDTTPDALRKLVNNGLWLDNCHDEARRAEGFNRMQLAPWTD